QYSTLSVASDGANWVVTWSGNDFSSGSVVTGARVAADGQILDPGGKTLAAEAIFDAYGPKHVSPDIGFSGDEYLLVWNKLELTGNPPDQLMTVLGQRFTLSLDPIASSFVINPAVRAGVGFSQTPKVATDGSDFLVVWNGGGRAVSHQGQVAA